MGLFGAIGNFLSGGNQGKAAKASQAAVDALANLETPDVTQMELQLEELVQQGVLTPEQAQVYLQDKSEMAGISTDPSLQTAQYDALEGLQDISQNGMTAMDRAKLGEIQTQEQTQARGAREAIMQSAQQRGAGGSGMELLQQMQNQQDSATRQSSRDLGVAGMAQQRALDALQAGGAMAGQMQGQSFDQKAQQAKSQDVINQFNTANQQHAANRVADSNNSAQAANLAATQSIADAGVHTRNTQQQSNKQLAQLDFDNRYKKAGGVSNAHNAQADQFNKAGAATTNLVGTGITSAASYFSDERVKEDIQPFDPSEFLDSLTAKQFSYKKPKHGQGKFAGPMAQDLEKTEIGANMVSEDEEGTKVVDTGRAAMTSLASLADIHKRIKKLEGK